jgi:hypothetical protein
VPDKRSTICGLLSAKPIKASIPRSFQPCAAGVSGAVAVDISFILPKSVVKKSVCLNKKSAAESSP